VTKTLTAFAFLQRLYEHGEMAQKNPLLKTPQLVFSAEGFLEKDRKHIPEMVVTKPGKK